MESGWVCVWGGMWGVCVGVGVCVWGGGRVCGGVCVCVCLFLFLFFFTLAFEASQVAMLNVKMVSDDCKIHRSVSLVSMARTTIERPYIVRIDTLFPFLTDLVRNISLFPLFQYGFDSHFGQQSWILWSRQS